MNPYPHSCTAAMPAWDEICQAIEGIFERRYYTENGPMVQTLEKSLKQHTGMGQVVCISNGFVAALMLLNTLPAQGHVLLAGGALGWLEPAIAWFPGLVSNRCAAHDATSTLTPETRAIIVQEKEAVAAIKQACIDIARSDILVVLDVSASPLASPSGADAHLCRMRECDPLNAVDGAYVATANLDLADTLRSMRSSSGVTRKMSVNKTVNGRLSEAHAAIGLITLRQLDTIPTGH